MAWQFGEAPWNTEGDVNPAGVPYGRLSDMVLAKEFQIDDYDNCFACRKCGAMVRVRPRPFNCAKEPVGWWWCRACQSTHAPLALNTVKAKRQALAASGCKKLDSVFGLKR
jgi:hypothetical protein